MDGFCQALANHTTLSLRVRKQRIGHQQHHSNFCHSIVSKCSTVHKIQQNMDSSSPVSTSKILKIVFTLPCP